MQERPKILTRFTVESALTLALFIDDEGNFDTEVPVTIPAGSYYVAGDGQSDDFLWVIMNACYTALVASNVDGYDDERANGKLILDIVRVGVDGDDAHRVRASVGGGSVDIRIAWANDDGPTIAAILGFNSGSTTDLTAGNNRTAAGTWQHAYGWYANEDGQFVGLKYVDDETANALQSVSLSGHVKTQYIDSRYTNLLQLAFLSRPLTYSDGVSYTGSPVDPSEKNIPLECWWHEARQGIEFRVYRKNYISGITKAQVAGAPTGGSSTTLADSGKSFDTDPQKHRGKILVVDGIVSVPLRFFISGHTSTTFTVPNGLLNENLAYASQYYVLDQRYRTYVVDMQRMQKFEPIEIPNIVRFDISVPLLRYES